MFVYKTNLPNNLCLSILKEEVPMDKASVETNVKKVVANVLKVEETDITDDANFIFDLGADSTQSIELIAAFEEEFDIEMDEDKALEVQTISDAIEYISGYLN